MKVKGYYVWCKNLDGNFSTIFLPSTDYGVIRKYFEEHAELECLANIFDEKDFNESEKNELFFQMLDLYNL